MKQKKWFVVLPLALALVLSACGGSPAATAAQAGQPGQGGNAPEMGIESRLAIGTLKLEGTDLAVDKDEAAALLPLWKALKSMSSLETTSEEEIQALYDQIQESMTKEQIAEIEKMEISGESMQELMKELGVEMAGPGGQTASSGSSSSSSTRTQGGGGDMPGGGGPGGGGGDMPAGGGGGGMPAGDMPGGGMGGDMPGATGTQQAGSATGGTRMGGMSLMFVEPVIKLLQERAGIVSATETPAP